MFPLLVKVMVALASVLVPVPVQDEQTVDAWSASLKVIVAVSPLVTFPDVPPLPLVRATAVGAPSTEKLCWTWVAAFQLPLPAWLAFRVQVPGPWKLTTPLPLIEQTLELKEATVMADGEARGGAGRRGVGGAHRLAGYGAVEVKVMVWVPLPTEKLCWTWVATL